MGWVGINRHSDRHTPRKKCKMRSKIWWLTGFCNSHDVSHFAAFFIVVGAKTSIAESDDYVKILQGPRDHHEGGHLHLWLRDFPLIRFNFLNHFRWLQKDCNGFRTPASTREVKKKVFNCPWDDDIALPPERRRNEYQLKICGNDPSAGSPTETLLRLHLPLNIEV